MTRDFGPFLVEATTFQPQALAYGQLAPYRDHTRRGVALPCRFEAPEAWEVDVELEDGRSVFGEPIIDVGPHNISNPWWVAGGIPMAVYQRQTGQEAQNGKVPTNDAGVDLAFGTCAALGLPYQWKGRVKLTIRQKGEQAVEDETSRFTEMMEHAEAFSHAEEMEGGKEPPDDFRDDQGQLRRVMASGRVGRVCDRCERVFYRYLLGPIPCRLFTRGPGEDAELEDPENYGHVCRYCATDIRKAVVNGLRRRISNGIELADAVALIERILRLKD